MVVPPDRFTFCLKRLNRAGLWFVDALSFAGAGKVESI